MNDAIRSSLHNNQNSIFSSMNRYKGSEIPEVLPYLLPNNSFIILGIGTIGSGKGETVISPCNHLRFTFDYFLELQLRSTSPVILSDSEIGDFGDMRIVDVIDGTPSTRRKLVPCSRIGEQNNEEEEKNKKRWVSHDCYLFKFRKSWLCRLFLACLYIDIID